MQILQHLFLLFIFLYSAVSGFTQQWNYKTPMPSARKSMAVAVYQDRIWVMGGNGGRVMGPSYSSLVEVYDPVTDTWDTSIPDLTYPRAEGVAQNLNDQIFIFGGLNGNGLVKAVEKYDPVSGNWQVVSEIPTPRRGLTSVIKDSVIWLMGGSNLQNNFYNFVEIYNPRSNSWDTLAAIFNTPRSDAMSASNVWGVFMFGGNFFGPVNLIERFNPQTQQWNIIGVMLYHCLAAGYTARGDSVWIIGGMGVNGSPLDRVQVFYRQNEQFGWWEGPPLNTARRELVAATVEDKIYAIGGRGMSGHNYYDLVEELSLVTDISHDPANLPDATAVLVNYPNPFNASTTIQCRLPQRDLVRVELLTILGQRLKTIFEGPLASGKHRFQLTSSDFSGIEKSSGVYFIRVIGQKTYLTHKIFLLK